jgi:hypothetical protein
VLLVLLGVDGVSVGEGLGLSVRHSGSSWSSRLDLIRCAAARSVAVMPEVT